MRYAVIEYHGLRPNRRFIRAYRDLSLSSANDLVRAWGYQAGQKGGWMTVVEDTQDAIDLDVELTLQGNTFKFASDK